MDQIGEEGRLKVCTNKKLEMIPKKTLLKGKLDNKCNFFVSINDKTIAQVLTLRSE